MLDYEGCSVSSFSLSGWLHYYREVPVAKLHEYDMQVHLRSVGHIFLTQGPVSFLSGL